MRLDYQRESQNVEDRRRLRGGARSIGIGTIVMVLLALYFGVDPSTILNMGQSMNPGSKSALSQFLKTMKWLVLFRKC